MTEARRVVADPPPVAEARTGAAIEMFTDARTTTCLRCGLPDGGDAFCPRCSMPWVAPAPAVPDVLPPGVRPADPARRLLAYGVDVVVLAVLVAAVVLSGGLLRAVAVVVLVVLGVVGLAVLLRSGRSPGRRLAGLRTVDARVGEPVGFRRVAARLVRGHRPGLLLADLRGGRDPLELPLPGPADLRARRRGIRRDDPALSLLSAGERALLAYAAPLPGGGDGRDEPRETVGLVLGDGRRFEVAGTLLLGRNPVDAEGEGATLAAWPDLSRRLARTHLRADWTGSMLWVTDLHSVGGTALVGPDGVRRTLEAGVRAAAPTGSTIECGGRVVTVVRGG